MSSSIPRSRGRGIGGPKANYNDPAKIRKHYDVVSPYYRALWGEHLHHGYWISGEESKEQAQIQLVEHLVEAAEIRTGAKLLDAGCGYGGSSLYLARTHGVDATGITLSPVQVEMAERAAAEAGARAKFLVMDAQEMTLPRGSFDIVWSIESISHYKRKSDFFQSAAMLLKPGGALALTDWFRKAGLGRSEYEKFLRPIERGMLVSLDTMEEYAAMLEASGLRVKRREILNEHCAKTWELCLEIIRKREFWTLAAKKGPEFVQFLQAFRAMRAGFASGNFVYGLLVATKSRNSG